MSQAAGPAAPIGADLVPDDVTEGNVEQVARRPGQNPWALIPETPSPDRKDGPMQRGRKQGGNAVDFEPKPDFNISRFRKEEISTSKEGHRCQAEDCKSGHPPRSRWSLWR